MFWLLIEKFLRGNQHFMCEYKNDHLQESKAKYRYFYTTYAYVTTDK